MRQNAGAAGYHWLPAAVRIEPNETLMIELRVRYLINAGARALYASFFEHFSYEYHLHHKLT